ncbi:hypothetical protein [Yersinia pekkanenii]|uniref:Uncharacterized protein n=1 Tax=Yersinia pekkanenii TaxID=1288385 RepID=A0A0T9RL29_9GAMM|nr:hypothetical protein [Yersinia pekkanenii]CNI69548.1 Uncharacterised protein [Yersinia pekkanenii]CRY63706.1 Uncharacterised protein [Yersinia pekkanenii]
MNNIEELKKAALGANLHGWTGFEDALNDDGYSEAVSKFIGHCRPSEILALIAQLEAAQKERDELKELNCHFDLSIRKTEGVNEVLRSKLEAAERALIKPLPIGELVHRLEGQTYEKWFSESDVKDLRERAEKAEAALSAANEKLSKPIAVSRGIENIELRQPLEVEDMWRHRFIASIKAAGFTVEGNADAE